MTRFIDDKTGALREFFGTEWDRHPGIEGRIVEPGHQFEWAWLLLRWAERRGNADGLVKARRLFEIGEQYGIAQPRDVSVMTLPDDFSVADPIARLWPQTEWLKAALIMAEDDEADAATREIRLEEATRALNGLFRYLTPEGLWRDRHDGGPGDDGFVDEPAPASSLYHIMVAFLQLARSKALPHRTDDVALALAGRHPGPAETDRA
jgi:mannose-6-phosphate isomerase